MTIPSILIIENNIANIVHLTKTLSEYMDSYTLAIARDINEAVVTPKVAQIILLNASQLYPNLTTNLSLVIATYPQTHLILLIPPSFSLEEQETLLHEALHGGVEDYVMLSPVGLISLGRRLVKDYGYTADAERDTLSQLINEATSKLGLQGIGPDNHIRTWNQAAEYLFGLAQSEVLGQPLDTLPLPTDDLTRLQEIVAQARTTAEPFWLPDYALPAQAEQKRWGQVYVYPVSQSSDQSVEHVYILTMDITALKEAELSNRRYNQELQVLLEISRQISEQLDLDTILETIVEEAKSLLNADHCQVYFLEEESHHPPIFSIGPDLGGQFQQILQLDDPQDLQATLNAGQGVMLNFIDLKENNLTPTEAPSELIHLLCAPLMVSKQAIGLMLARRSHKVPFQPEELRFFENLVQQATSAINNARLFEEIQRNLAELSVLYEASTIISVNWNTQEVLNILTQKMVVVIDAQQGYIIDWDKTQNAGVVKAAFVNGSNPASLLALEIGQTFSLATRSVLQTTLEEQRTVLFEGDNPALDAMERANLEAQGASVGLILPLVVKGETIGWAEVLGSGVELFTVEKIRLARLLSNQAAVALENAQYLQQMEQAYQAELRRRQQAETLREISAVVGSSFQLNEVLERILDQLQRVVKYDSAAIHLVEGNRRRIIAGHGFTQPEQVIGLTFPLSPNENEPGSLVIHHREPIVIGNVSDQYTTFKQPPHDYIRSWLGIPLIARDKVIGLITIDREVAHAFSQDDMNLAQAFANQVAIALENARLYELEVNEIERELTIAHEIQETLLPQFAPQIPGLQISGRMTPVHQIGGDFFYFFDPAQGQFGLAIGDVSGKGIPAALYMAAVMTAIDAEISHKNPNPGQLLRNLHQILYERLKQNRMNIGLQVATFAPHRTEESNLSIRSGAKIMTIANAGMISPIVATEAGCHLLSTSGFPLGAPIREPTYVEEKIWLSPGTAVIFTSDGIVEAQNEIGELFSFERLEATVNEIIHTHDAELIAEHIIYKAQAFMNEAKEQHDDMTVVVVVIKEDE